MVYQNNYSEDRGDGIYINGENITIENSVISGNSTNTISGLGGGVFLKSSDGIITNTHSIRNCVFLVNNSFRGGGLYRSLESMHFGSNANLQIVRSIFTSNVVGNYDAFDVL